MASVGRLRPLISVIRITDEVIMTKIILCKCENKYQDKLYGKGRRVHNSTKEENTYRCTVCLDVKVVK